MVDRHWPSCETNKSIHYTDMTRYPSQNPKTPKPQNPKTPAIMESLNMIFPKKEFSQTTKIINKNCLQVIQRLLDMILM